MGWGWLEEEGWRTLVLVNLAGIMERADEALLPGVYREVGLALHASPTALGMLTLLRSLTQAACFPVAAYLALHHNRAHMIALGAFLWAAATFLVGISTSFLQVAVSRALNGIGLAIVVPAIQSLVADSADDGNRGWAFGWLQFTGNLGSILGGLFSVLLAATTVMGIPGWRISFHLVALVSVVVGVLVRLFAVDPRFSNVSMPTIEDDGIKGVSPLWSNLRALILEAKKVMRIHTFQIIVAQGVVGSFPWSALSFVPMWLELIGFSHQKTAFLMGLFVVGNSLGGLFGGRMGDILSRHLPNAGRIILSQISSGLSIPLGAVLLLVLPDDPSTGMAHGLMFFILGFSISWNAAATNNPIFAEIVPLKSRTSIYALDRSFESIFSSFAPPIVGILSQHVYGYKPVPQGSSKSAEIETDRENAASLADSLYTTIAIPMTLCCLIYTFLYRTYPKDRDRARLEAQLELEMGRIRIDTLDPPDSLSFEIHEQHDDDDEKRLLSSETRETEHILENEI
uniref:Major facilitator superfamily (MFS) profile domain-containing protein n=1 Tax=Araucaria cunninghamii TaxID=56994 RepID=A0A0D6QYQ9_ARACU